MPSAATVWFEEIFKGQSAYGYIQSVDTSAEPVVENEWRDFKEKNPQGKERELRTAWSEALAAFANTEGGVVVWGVECKRNQHGIDQVREVRPIDGPEQWAQRLRDWHIEATSQPVTGVQIEVVKHPNENKGFVV